MATPGGVPLWPPPHSIFPSGISLCCVSSVSSLCPISACVCAPQFHLSQMLSHSSPDCSASRSGNAPGFSATCVNLSSSFLVRRVPLFLVNCPPKHPPASFLTPLLQLPSPRPIPTNYTLKNCFFPSTSVSGSESAFCVCSSGFEP